MINGNNNGERRHQLSVGSQYGGNHLRAAYRSRQFGINVNNGRFDHYR
jgi:hypothetical protein